MRTHSRQSSIKKLVALSAVAVASLTACGGGSVNEPELVSLEGQDVGTGGDSSLPTSANGDSSTLSTALGARKGGSTRQPPAPAPAPSPTAAPATPPSVSPISSKLGGTWTRIATANANYNLSGVQMVRYGDGTQWLVRQDSGAGNCSNIYFGYWGGMQITECQVYAPSLASVPTVAPGGGPMIDLYKVPFANPGFSDIRLKSTNEVAPLGGDGTGSFRLACEFSHMLAEDPLVAPGVIGGSHLHVFFGNTGTNAKSTPTSIATTGSSSCRGGTMNRSAYWAPAMIDTASGIPVAPTGANIYYKTGYNGIQPGEINFLPAGLRMIAGDSKNSSLASASGTYRCENYNGSAAVPARANHIINCPVGSEMWMDIYFPQCWDGVNLASPDHKSHMSYTVNGRCPASHPVALPEISMHLVYPVKEANAPLRWRLSSDNYATSLPGGLSAHGDWMDGWVQSIMQTWVNQCNRAARDCHSHLLGDGREFFGY